MPSNCTEYVLDGWPSHIPDELITEKRSLVSTENGCLMWSIRVIVPQTPYTQVLKCLHANHTGITRMKAIARSYFWWGRLDRDIEELGKSCHSCQATQTNPPVAPLHPWIWPDSPWKRVHIDFAGPFQGHTLYWYTLPSTGSHLVAFCISLKVTGRACT